MRVGQQVGRGSNSDVNVAPEYVGQRRAIAPSARRPGQCQQQPGAQGRGNMMPRANGGMQPGGVAGYAGRELAERQSHVHHSAVRGARASARPCQAGELAAAASASGSVCRRRPSQKKLKTPTRRTSAADRYSAACSPDSNALYTAWITSWTSLGWPAPAVPPAPLALPPDGVNPVSTPWITKCAMLCGKPSWCNLAMMFAESLADTSAPSTATPATAPTSRLVLVVDAAMPDRSAGTADSAEDVAGTTVPPIPMPVSDKAAASAR